MTCPKPTDRTVYVPNSAHINLLIFNVFFEAVAGIDIDRRSHKWLNEELYALTDKYNSR